MRRPTPPNFNGLILRTSPHYELVPVDRLTPEQQQMLGELRGDPTLFGVLRPRVPSGLVVKAIDRETALLLFALQTPGPLPTFARTSLGDDAPRAIAELVLDGVLDVERGGAYISGPDAYELLCGKTDGLMARGAVARLSVAAVQYGQALEIDDCTMLSARLYFFNRQPASPAWRRRLPSRQAVATLLGVDRDGANTRKLARHWHDAPPAANGRWRSWQQRAPRTPPVALDRVYKLYISPTCDEARPAFDAVVETLPELGAVSFKTGNDLYELLRPDKIVLYFWEQDVLHDAAERLRSRLVGCAAHGVPFTAALDEDGLLSWGIDPPSRQQTPGRQGPESWRLWVTNRLATALLAAKTSPSRELEPWQFALARLGLDGVDTETWTPMAAIWPDSLNGGT
jgi:hypothetical protein